MVSSTTFIFALLAPLAASSVVPHEVVYPRATYPDVVIPKAVIYPDELAVRQPVRYIPSSHAELDKREFDANHTYDVSWQAHDQTIFSAKWAGGGTRGAASAAGSFSLTLECLDCRTWGTVLADFHEDDLKVTVSLTFHNFGAHFDLGAVFAGEGTFSIGLGVFNGKKPNDDDFLKADLVLGIDLFVSVDVKLDLTGGFQLTIPDGEQVSIHIDRDFDASMSGMPKANFGLLPIAMSNAAAKGTIGVRLRAMANMRLGSGSTSVSGGAGAYLVLAELKFGGSQASSGSCKNALSVGIDGNAGAFASAGASAHGTTRTIGPSTSTTFYSLGTTLCLADKTPALHKTQPAPQIAASNCPAGLQTQTATITTTYSITSCVIAAVNCPGSLTQVIQVVNTESVTTTTCPGVTPQTDAPATTPTVKVDPPSLGDLAALPMLPVPITDALKTGSASVQGPLTATVTGEFVAITATDAAGTLRASYVGLFGSILAAVLLI